VFPFFDKAANQSVITEVASIGVLGSIIIVVAFFTMVAFYCTTLQRCLALIKPENRKAKPKNVWLMFAIPFNFVEDFFIVIQLANSIEEEKKSNVSLKYMNDFGMVSGIGWCISQILSFIPNLVGQISSVVGLLLVVVHWIQIAKINRLLSCNTTIKSFHS
jgi:hypothetical protein